MASNFTKIVNMNLDDKLTYKREHIKLYNMPLEELKEKVAELGKKRYEEQDIEVDAHFRMASGILHQKARTGGSLIFHMKNFLGALVGMVLFRIFVV
jgi:FtsZ-binding cell division protein ZapB